MGWHVIESLIQMPVVVALWDNTVQGILRKADARSSSCPVIHMRMACMPLVCQILACPA